MITRKENPFLLDKYMETSTAEVIAINRTTGEEMFLSTLESHELTHDQEEELIKGGIWNDTLATINKNKTIKFKVTDPIARMDVQMKKLGADIKTGSVMAWHFDRPYPVEDSSSNKIVNLTETPFDTSEVCVYNTKTKKMLQPTTDYTISGKVITILASDINVNDNVFVTSFQYEKASVQYADITGKSAPQTFALIVRSPLFDENDAVKYWKQMFFPKAKMSGSFSITGNTEKTKNTEDTEFTILKDDTYEYLGRIMFIPETEE